MMRRFYRFPCFLAFLGFYALSSRADIEIRHMEPHHWWVGMKEPKLQVLLHGPGLGKCSLRLLPGQPGLELSGTQTTDNPNYLFANFRISATAKAGLYRMELARGKEKKVLEYRLKTAAEKASGGAKGYGPEDVVYLLMPDRFANGDPANDDLPYLNERVKRDEPFGRHGGDLKGIEDRLDYIQDLGMTTLWINPILENNQPQSSYHGYAITDFYKVDPRFGTLEDYKRLIAKCHGRGMKMVQDMVANHIGSKHWWMDDKPGQDWIHPEGNPFNRCNFRIETVVDPHASKEDKDKMLKGWFDIHMPDLNQRNPLLGRYLIQNCIWWIAETGIDGIRMDTYPYNFPEYMTEWCEAIKKEFPSFSLVGEVWVDDPALTAYFTKGTKNLDGYRPGLPTVTDFPVYQGINKGLVEKGSWETGLVKIYHALMQDFLYADPSKHLLFLDNHDLTRFHTYHKENVAKFRQGVVLLLTLRGVPQWYYGTEILMTGDGAVHPEVRKDFPGGWPGDKANAFIPSGRSPKVDSAFQFCRKILNWRKSAPALKEGKFTQYLPEKNVYAYVRSHPKQEILVLVNGNDSTQTLDLSRMETLLRPYSLAVDVESGTSFSVKEKSWALPPRAAFILELKKP